MQEYEYSQMKVSRVCQSVLSKLPTGCDKGNGDDDIEFWDQIQRKETSRLTHKTHGVEL